jgi:predicted transcriptional regulator
MDNINSGADYAQSLIDSIIESEKLLPTDEQLPISLLTYWCEEIESYAELTYHYYITGEREHFAFDADELKELFEKAGMRYTGDILDGLVDKDMVQVSVREDGEMVYSTTDKGKQALKNSKNGK